MLALAAFLLAVAPAAAQEDVLDVRSTDLVLGDVGRMTSPAWFLAGFALGWHGDGRDGVPLAIGEAMAAYAGVAGLLKRRALVAANRARPLMTILAGEIEAGRLPLAVVSGADWIALELWERLAMLQGIHGGQYTRALRDEPGGVGADDAALDAALARARRLVKPRLAYAPTLLFARLSDYYFYVDRREERLIDSIAVLAAQIAESQQ